MSNKKSSPNAGSFQPPRSGLSPHAQIFQPGDWVIYRKQKSSPSPGPRAQLTNPAPKGETYNYLVDKYWVVEAILDDGSVRLRTRRGKQHVVQADDPRLRAPTWWQRWILRRRFREVEQSDLWRKG